MIDCPPTIQTRPNGGETQTCLFRPRGHCLLLPLKGEHMRSPAVASLSCRESPPAVAGLVVPVVVDPVESVTRCRRLAHVFVEQLERAPSFANGYSSPTIPRIRGVVGVLAPITHGLPRSMRAGASATVTTILIPEAVAAKAPATSHLPGGERGCRAIAGCAARAQTLVGGLLPAHGGRQSHHGQTTKRPSGQVGIASRSHVQSIHETPSIYIGSCMVNDQEGPTHHDERGRYAAWLVGLGVVSWGSIAAIGWICWIVWRNS